MGALHRGKKSWFFWPSDWTICLTLPAGPGRLVQMKGEINAAEYREILEKNQIHFAKGQFFKGVVM